MLHLPNQNWDHKMSLKMLEDFTLQQSTSTREKESVLVRQKKNKVIDLCPHGTLEWREFLKGRKTCPFVPDNALGNISCIICYHVGMISRFLSGLPRTKNLEVKMHESDSKLQKLKST